MNIQTPDASTTIPFDLALLQCTDEQLEQLAQERKVRAQTLKQSVIGNPTELYEKENGMKGFLRDVWTLASGDTIEPQRSFTRSGNLEDGTAFRVTYSEYETDNPGSSKLTIVQYTVTEDGIQNVRGIVDEGLTGKAFAQLFFDSENGVFQDDRILHGGRDGIVARINAGNGSSTTDKEKRNMSEKLRDMDGTYDLLLSKIMPTLGLE